MSEFRFNEVIDRPIACPFCEGKRVLDICCNTGGFAVYAKVLGRAREVVGIDLDEQVIELARQNANLNQVRVKFVQADVFPYMRDALRNGRKFDVVVLDPPKLIRNRMELEEGTRRHFDLNRLAMQLVAPGGLMLSCSCAGLLPEEEFVKLCCSAASTEIWTSRPTPSHGRRRGSSAGGRTASTWWA